MDDDFYHSAFPELGLRKIHQACLRGDFEAVVKLACQPGTIDVPTEPQNGFLVEQGAALTHGRVLATTYTGNEGLAARRRDFFLNTVGIGREHPDAVNTRKTIFDILSSPGRRSVVRAMCGPRADLGYPDYKLAKQGRDIVVFAPVLRIRSDIPLDRSKTIGIITSKAASGDILMSAHSGFREGSDRHEKCLDTNRWNYIALHHISKLLQFHFPGNKHDNGSKKIFEDIHRGRAHAGHVEVLLAAWYAIEMTKQQGMAGNGGTEKSLEWCLDNMHILKHVTLGEARSAVIMIDSQPCATCLKFINFLFQYTGLHFSVKGAVGVGPTLATKDERTGVRLDTFGDTFEEQDIDGAEGYEEPATFDLELDVDTEVDAVLETPIARGVPGGIRETIEENEDGDRAGDDMTVHAQAQAASEAFARISSFMPADMDTENVPMTTPAPETVTPQRTGPITPLRPRMRWGVPEPGPRLKRGDLFSNIPSRRPANPEELLAEYKKKTPVWTWPGYNSADPSPDRYPRIHRPHLGSPAPLALPDGGTLIPDSAVNNDENDDDAVTVVNDGVARESPQEGEDPVIVDMVNDDVSYLSPSGSSAVRDSLADFNARLNHHFDGTPAPMSRERSSFSNSSFQPIPSPAHTRAKDPSKNKNVVREQPQFQPQSQTRVEPFRSDSPMQPNPPENEDGYIYVPQPSPPSLSKHSRFPSQRPQPTPQPSQAPSEPTFLSQTGSRYYAAALLMDAESPDPTPCPVPARAPVPTRAPAPAPAPAARKASNLNPTTTPAPSTFNAISTPVTIPPTKAKQGGLAPLNFQQWRFEPQPRMGEEVVSRHFGGPKLQWHQQGIVSFPEVPGQMGGRPGLERRGGIGRKG
ncbi:hypothetical protein F5B19DRAFT_488553 [Rostrohypoxylon terebratum]|nr:hypothetical protein F5B19DRAFT_488553 [Rostrohypoxylon terebratum]